ncbi:MAG TPA: hypothetical protein V6D05_16295 [Stenomitos sp.]
MAKQDELFSLEPNVNREITLVIIGTLIASAIIAILMSYAP